VRERERDGRRLTLSLRRQESEGSLHQAADSLSQAYESQRDQLASQSFNLDQAAFASSSLADTASTVAAMKVSPCDVVSRFSSHIVRICAASFLVLIFSSKAASGALKTQLGAVKGQDRKLLLFSF
jgi:hypothetical protein